MSALASVLGWLSGLRSERRRRRRERKRARRRRIAEAVVERWGPRVQRGPFAGMLYPWLEAAGSALTPKLLGSYEEEVHPLVERIARRGWRRVVNIGCAEGYYAVGMARLLPQARVLAFDTDERSRRLCAELALANGVGERVTVAGECAVEQLREATGEPCAIVCDCEGGELDLLDPERVPGLLRCDLLVELHPIPGVKSTAESLRSRFAATHEARLVRFREREPGRFPAVAFLPRRYRRLALAEFRRRGREWMLLERRGG